MMLLLLGSGKGCPDPIAGPRSFGPSRRQPPPQRTPMIGAMSVAYSGQSIGGMRYE